MTHQKKSPSGHNRNGAEKFRHFQRTNSFTHPQDVAQSFNMALDNAGLSTKDKIIPDGNLHRFHVNGDRNGSKNGWYVLFGDGVPAGCFGSWRTGDKGTWCAKADCALTPCQREENKQRMIKARKIREAEQQTRYSSASDKAISIWKAAQPALDTHPYLALKGVGNHGLRLYKNLLVIPIRDGAGNILSLQFIDDEGNKRFLSGGRKKGCYFAVGVPTESLCIAEGYATAASIYESTGIAVAVAFDAGNLEPVALALRNKFPHIKITICADNDMNTQGNPGLTKARKAAAAVNGFLAVAGGLS